MGNCQCWKLAWMRLMLVMIWLLASLLASLPLPSQHLYLNSQRRSGNSRTSAYTDQSSTPLPIIRPPKPTP